jgi:hypothetical protein
MIASCVTQIAGCSRVDVSIERYQGTSETSQYASNEMSKFDFLSNIIFKVRRDDLEIALDLKV